MESASSHKRYYYKSAKFYYLLFFILPSYEKIVNNGRGLMSWDNWKLWLKSDCFDGSSWTVVTITLTFQYMFLVVCLCPSRTLGTYIGKLYSSLFWNGNSFKQTHTGQLWYFLIGLECFRNNPWSWDCVRNDWKLLAQPTTPNVCLCAQYNCMIKVVHIYIFACWTPVFFCPPFEVCSLFDRYRQGWVGRFVGSQFPPPPRPHNKNKL